jgi:hypothetical protein
MTRLYSSRAIALYCLFNCVVSVLFGTRDAIALLRAAPTGTAPAIANALFPLATLLALQGYGASLLLMSRLKRPIALAIPLVAQVVWFRVENAAFAFASGLVLGPVIEPAALTIEASWSWSYWAERRLNGSFEYIGVNFVPLLLLVWLLVRWRDVSGTQDVKAVGLGSEGG